MFLIMVSGKGMEMLLSLIKLYKCTVFYISVKYFFLSPEKKERKFNPLLPLPHGLLSQKDVPLLEGGIIQRPSLVSV